MRLRRHGAPGERVVVRQRTLTALESEERERREMREERAAASAGEGREGEERRKREWKADSGPHTMWRLHQQNYLPKPSNGQI